MKCDDLKSVYIDRTGDWVRSGNDTGKFYLKSEADAVIADLQKTNVMLADNAVKLNRELESLKASHYAEMVDAGMRERRLRRAFYKACANWAHVAVAFFSSYATKEKWRKMENKCRAKEDEYK